MTCKYLVSDLGEKDENDDDKQIVNDSNNCNNAIDDFELKSSSPE